MTDNKHIDFPIHFQMLDEVVEVKDERFAKVKIWLMHLGMNEYKNTLFAKEIVDNALPTLKNIPIIAKVQDYGIIKDFKGHEAKQNRDGTITKDTKIIGVIPESNNVQYEQRLCDDYVERTFVTVEGLIWTSRAKDELEILERDKVKGHSMELHPTMSKYVVREDGVIFPTYLTFDGACILGDLNEPAMTNSTIELFSKEDLASISLEIQEKLNIYHYERSRNMEKLFCKECGLEEVEGKPCTCGNTEFVEIDKVSKKENSQEEGKEAEDTVEKKPQNPSQDTDVDKTEESSGEGEEATVLEEESVAEENVSEATETEENDTGKAVLPVEFSQEQIDEYYSLKKEVVSLREEVSSLRSFKSEIEIAEREREMNSLFEKYSMLDEVKEYKEIKEKSNEFSVEDFDKECALIFTNNINQLNYSKEEESKNSEEDLGAYGILFGKEDDLSEGAYGALLK